MFNLKILENRKNIFLCVGFATSSFSLASGLMPGTPCKKKLLKPESTSELIVGTKFNQDLIEKVKKHIHSKHNIRPEELDDAFLDYALAVEKAQKTLSPEDLKYLEEQAAAFGNLRNPFSRDSLLGVDPVSLHEQLLQHTDVLNKGAVAVSELRALDKKKQEMLSAARSLREQISAAQKAVANHPATIAYHRKYLSVVEATKSYVEKNLVDSVAKKKILEDLESIKSMPTLSKDFGFEYEVEFLRKEGLGEPNVGWLALHHIGDVLESIQDELSRVKGREVTVFDDPGLSSLVDLEVDLHLEFSKTPLIFASKISHELFELKNKFVLAHQSNADLIGSYLSEPALPPGYKKNYPFHDDPLKLVNNAIQATRELRDHWKDFDFTQLYEKQRARDGGRFISREDFQARPSIGLLKPEVEAHIDMHVHPSSYHGYKDKKPPSVLEGVIRYIEEARASLILDKQEHSFFPIWISRERVFSALETSKKFKEWLSERPNKTAQLETKELSVEIMGAKYTLKVVLCKGNGTCAGNYRPNELVTLYPIQGAGLITYKRDPKSNKLVRVE